MSQQPTTDTDVTDNFAKISFLNDKIDQNANFA